MKDKRLVQLTLKVYAEIVVPANSDVEAEDVINGMDVTELVKPIGDVRIKDSVVEIDSIELE